MIRHARKSKTMWFALILVVLGVIYDNFSYIQDIVDPRIYGVSYIVVGVVVAILRFYTVKPLDEK